MANSKTDETGFKLLRPQGRSRFVLLCDHASNEIPADLDHLGLSPAVLATHIAWDVGAAGVAVHLSRLLDAPAILSPVSRLVVDCNRLIDAPDAVPEISDGIVIPGNRGLSPEARALRISRWFTPYHDAVEALLEARLAEGAVPFVVSVHSMAAAMGGIPRPWEIALSTHIERRFAQPVLAALRGRGDVVVGDNQPYDLDPAVDFSIPYHAMRRDLPHLQVEFRQDLIGAGAGQEKWAQLFAEAIGLVL
jgi:predicted N-formylglutamate amidohydrolase